MDVPDLLELDVPFRQFFRSEIESVQLVGNILDS